MNLHVLTYNVFGMPWGLQSIESILLWAFYDTDAEILCLQEVFSEDHKNRIQEVCNRSFSQWNCWFPQAEPTCLSRLTSYFSSITGLCILTRKSIEILATPYFEAFQNRSNVDRWVQKGFFHIHCQKEETIFHLITTHFQSDFTECKFRVRYENQRKLQEAQLFEYCKNLPNVILLGDFNTKNFRYFSFINPILEITLKETGESLDHCLSLPSSRITCKFTKYFHDIVLSDHTPVLFHLKVLPSVKQHLSEMHE